jgi:hypothetical protein
MDVVVGPGPSYEGPVPCSSPEAPRHVDARDFEVTAAVGSEVYGILSNPFLDQAFRTVSYRMHITVHAGGTWSYEEEGVLEIAGRDAPFHHIDRNTLTRRANRSRLTEGDFVLGGSVRCSFQRGELKRLQVCDEQLGVAVHPVVVDRPAIRRACHVERRAELARERASVIS